MGRITFFAAAIAAALRAAGIRQETSTPGLPRTNGVAERQVQEVINGTRVLLVKAGLPTSYWPYAMRAWCFSNGRDKGYREIASEPPIKFLGLELFDEES